MSFPRYPAYKPSGVEWLGEVPEHWEVLPLKRNARLLTDKTDNRSNPVALEHIESWTGRLIETQTEFEGEGVSFEVGDILFGKLRPYLAKAYLATASGEAVGDFHVIHSSASLLPHLLQYQLLNREVIDLVNSSTYGAKMPRASWSFLGSIAMPVPPLQEQLPIATFLTHETAKIDALIAEQQRLIELLQEKRQAVISHAVTKGLNPDAPMKDSGVEWLGEVPEHWDVTTIKRIVSTPVTDGPHETPEFIDEGIPFVSAEAVSSGRINWERIRGFISEDDHKRYSQKYLPMRDDIFMVKSGATTGVSAIVDTGREFNIWSPLAVIRCGSEVLPRFALHFIRSRNFLEGVTLGWSFGTQQNIGMGVIENLAILVAPHDEQNAIVEQLDSYVNNVDALIVEATKATALLQERRSALISAAVTGQIDVRDLVPEAVAA
jgi:type I restriction enzyme S subunit